MGLLWIFSKATIFSEYSSQVSCLILAGLPITREPSGITVFFGNQASCTYNTVLCQADPERFARPQLMSITKFLSGKRQLLLFYNKNDHIGFQNFRNPFSGRYQKQ